MAEALNSLFKAECIRNPILRGSGWRSIDDVELAVATYIDWYNHRRLHGLCRHGDYAEAVGPLGWGLRWSRVIWLPVVSA